MTRNDAEKLMRAISALALAHAQEFDEAHQIWVGKSDVEQAEDDLQDILEKVIV